jgi:acetoin utilization protein AcuB
MTVPNLARFMTASPHTIGQEQTLDLAHRLFREHGIRHLPVLEGGNLVGLLSARDLDFIETLKDVDPSQVQVSEAMTQDVFSVTPDAPLAKVVDEMAKHKYGCAVVQKDSRVVGVFTTVDALHALSQLLAARNT